jgi:fluoride exporter
VTGQTVLLWAAVAVAGGLGAASRFLLDRLISSRVAARLPLGTLVINVSGSLAAGIVLGLAVGGTIGDELRTVVAGGYLGAYTTFSTAMYETARLLEEGDRQVGVVNVLAPLLLSLLAATAGWWLVV